MSVNPLYLLAPDPTGKPPMCDEEQFVSVLDSMVAAHAPRIFAVVQEWGERVDARIAAWGLSFEDHAELLGVDGTKYVGLASPEAAMPFFTVGERVTPRLVWVQAASAD